MLVATDFEVEHRGTFHVAVKFVPHVVEERERVLRTSRFQVAGNEPELVLGVPRTETECFVIALDGGGEHSTVLVCKRGVVECPCLLVARIEERAMSLRGRG